MGRQDIHCIAGSRPGGGRSFPPRKTNRSVLGPSLIFVHLQEQIGPVPEAVSLAGLGACVLLKHSKAIPTSSAMAEWSLEGEFRPRSYIPTQFPTRRPAAFGDQSTCIAAEPPARPESCRDPPPASPPVVFDSRGTNPYLILSLPALLQPSPPHTFHSLNRPSPSPDLLINASLGLLTLSPCQDPSPFSVPLYVALYHMVLVTIRSYKTT
jgi:hypothetical protein